MDFNFEAVKNTLLQPAAQRGVILLLGALGVGVNPEHVNSILSLTLGLSGAIGIHSSRPKKNKEEE